MGTINLIQLAKHLGLSKSTVSRALKDSYDISAETKARVYAAAKELNYQPNPYASSLRRHISKTIALVIPLVENNFFSMVIKGIQAEAHKRNYHVLLYLSNDEPERERSIFQLLQTGRVDGVITSTVSMDHQVDHIRDFINKGKPVIFIDRVSAAIPATRITTDDVESAFRATELLIKKGCRRISYMYVLRDFSIGQRRFEGYKKALQAYDIPFDKSLVVDASQDYNKNQQLIYDLLSREDRPDGILSPVEKMAITSYYVCQELGLSIPDDVKIISYSNLSFASLLSPALTTVVPPAFEMGERATHLLLNSIERKLYKLQDDDIIMPSTIIERESTRI
jgi:LacI family transcriptional regulator